jgi:aspartyl protease family protein
VAKFRIRRALAAAALSMLGALPAWGTTVYVTSVGTGDVQLIVNGSNVRSLQIGEVSPEGVKLSDIRNGVAILEVDGRTMSMRIGQSTVSQTVLTADGRGHFVTTARINGVPVQALIDTGATLIALNIADAQRMGIDYLRGKPGITQTANGPVAVYVVNLAHVQIGDIAFSNVQGSVSVGAAAQQTPTLIGMSFLRHVEMRRSGNTMTLTRADR